MRKSQKVFPVLLSVIFMLLNTGTCAGGVMREGPRCDAGTLYSYHDMDTDIRLLCERYPDWIQADSLGKTTDGRELYHLLIGRQSASSHVLVFASIHAREYITTQLVMRQVNSFLQGLSAGNENYKNVSYKNLLGDVAVHIVPMVNPDGVTLSQFGIEAMQKSTTRQKIYRIYELDEAVELGPYLRRWKANAEGVDINRNFDAYWKEYDDRLGHPSSDRYKGEAAGCTNEAKALIELTKKYNFKRTISYHVQGEVIYWYFEQEGALLQESQEFAQAISKVTGYPLDGNYESLDPAGYKDWAIQKMNIPSLTIEVGRGEVPLDLGQLPGIYAENEKVLLEMIYSVR